MLYDFCTGSLGVPPMQQGGKVMGPGQTPVGGAAQPSQQSKAKAQKKVCFVVGKAQSKPYMS